MASFTLIEKIIRNHTNVSDNEIYPGNIVWVNLDLVTARDYAGPQVIDLFQQHYSGDIKMKTLILKVCDMHLMNKENH